MSDYEQDHSMIPLPVITKTLFFLGLLPHLHLGIEITEFSVRVHSLIHSSWMAPPVNKIAFRNCSNLLHQILDIYKALHVHFSK